MISSLLGLLLLAGMLTGCSYAGLVLFSRRHPSNVLRCAQCQDAFFCSTCEDEFSREALGDDYPADDLLHYEGPR